MGAIEIPHESSLSYRSMGVTVFGFKYKKYAAKPEISLFKQLNIKAFEGNFSEEDVDLVKWT